MKKFRISFISNYKHSNNCNYIVQVKILFIWVTIKKFSVSDYYLAKELLDLLNEQL